MNKIALTLIGLTLLITSHTFGQNDWKTYKYNIKNFEISCLQEPEFSVDSSEFGDSFLKTYYWEVNVSDSLHQNNYYSISAETYPSDFIHSDSSLSVIEGFINSTQNSLIEDKDFTLLSSTLDEKYGFPGKIFKWKSNTNNNFLQFQIYLIDNTLFQLAVVSKATDAHNIFVKKYFDSFKLIDSKKGTFSIPEISNEKTYKIEFPEEPTNQKKTADSDLGKLHMDIQVLEPKKKSDNLVYVSIETKYPSPATDEDDLYSLNSFYKRSIDASLSSVNGELISITDIYYNDKLGKEYRCYFSGGKALMVYRVFYIKDHYYSFGVITVPKKDNNKAMIKFFESFKLTTSK